jgi:hypothetical protein
MWEGNRKYNARNRYPTIKVIEEIVRGDKTGEGSKWPNGFTSNRLLTNPNVPFAKTYTLTIQDSFSIIAKLQPRLLFELKTATA